MWRTVQFGPRHAQAHRRGLDLIAAMKIVPPDDESAMTASADVAHITYRHAQLAHRGMDSIAAMNHVAPDDETSITAMTASAEHGGYVRGHRARVERGRVLAHWAVSTIAPTAKNVQSPQVHVHGR
jgi:hypothetical protein